MFKKNADLAEVGSPNQLVDVGRRNRLVDGGPWKLVGTQLPLWQGFPCVVKQLVLVAVADKKVAGAQYQGPGALLPARVAGGRQSHRWAHLDPTSSHSAAVLLLTGCLQ